MGTVFGLTVLLDFSWNLVSSIRQKNDPDLILSSYRTSYDLTKVRSQDIILVGDSMVWGAGVTLEQRFGNVLEARLQNSASHPRVYSLGIVGENLQGYIRQVQDVPGETRTKQVVVLFSANDMPPRSNLQDSLQQLAVSIGRGSVTMRAIVDLARIAITPNVEEYAALLLSHFEENDKTFPVRWQQLNSEFAALFKLSQERSQNRPALVLLPMLVDFHKAAYDEPRRRVGRAAQGIGFGVVDTMATFRADGLKAEAYRAAQNDLLHLNERGNQMIADVLFRLVNGNLKPCETLETQLGC